MAEVKIFLKGWRNSRLYTDAANSPAHELHAEAWALRDQMFLPYKAGDTMFLAITYQSGADDMVICNHAFERFNIGSDPIAQEYRRHGFRSLSVGDVVAIDDRAYSCDSFGWSLIENFKPTEAPR